MRRIRPTTVFSLLGIVLTTASVVASIAQYKAADLQAQAAVISLAPQIEVQSPLLKEDPDGSKFTDRHIVVSSDGGPVKNFDSESITWLEIGRYGEPVFQQPLNGYFHSTFNTGRQKGELATLVGHRNHQKFLSLSETARNFFPDGLGVEGPKSILSISYRDVFGKNQREFFFVSHGTAILLSVEDGAKRWQELRDLPSKVRPIDLDQMGDASKVKAWVDYIGPQLPPSRK
ncbi:hypothetical protein [Rhodoferax aquaticus]|uniref:Uncharacterized protein n=1 Tax=Rhodoferax aquaticus TaxID=2527691 RepID=A0A515EJU5_9BURK|nr:hypothetical protein [Rhodoferax aquaticus]QDL52944.1 hypothetical protein EXZ61_01460 [Rhodoferax aquaticus]